MRRREFITVVGGVTMWPLATRALQSAMPVIGYLTGGTLNKAYIEVVLQGLKEADFVEGRNIAIEYRAAEGRYEQLPALATDLAERKVVAILAEGGSASARAAQQATSTIPVVFVNGDDPSAVEASGSYCSCRDQVYLTAPIQSHSAATPS